MVLDNVYRDLMEHFGLRDAKIAGPALVGSNLVVVRDRGHFTIHAWPDATRRAEAECYLAGVAAGLRAVRPQRNGSAKV